MCYSRFCLRSRACRSKKMRCSLVRPRDKKTAFLDRRSPSPGNALRPFFPRTSNSLRRSSSKTGARRVIGEAIPSRPIHGHVIARNKSDDNKESHGGRRRWQEKADKWAKMLYRCNLLAITITDRMDDAAGTVRFPFSTIPDYFSPDELHV